MQATSALSEAQRALALSLARRAIERRTTQHRAVTLEALLDAPSPSPPRATFVTVYLSGELNGCIGKLEPTQPWLEDVVENAQKAAFEDPRFPPLTPGDLATLSLHISVLSPLERLDIPDEAALWTHVKPGVHGLMIEAGRARATFLPSVWEKCPEPEVFLAHLKRKAGLPPDRPTPGMRFFRYVAEGFSDAP